MSRKHHYLKTETEYFQAIEEEEKKFELRKDDRDFKMYDYVYFQEVVSGAYTGRELGPFEINYILHSKDAGKYGLAEGHCIFNWVSLG